MCSTPPKPTSQDAAHRFEHYEVMLDDDGIPVELGRGAMGVTYKAFDVDLRCPVTLKVISERYLGDESARLRFLREARAAARVRRTNVASVFHLGRTGENYFYMSSGLKSWVLGPRQSAQVTIDDDSVEAMVHKEQQPAEKLREQFHGTLILLRVWRTT